MTTTYYRKLKRVLDIVLSTTGILLLFPVLAVIAVLIKLTSRGPIVFRQVRLGRGKVPFHLYKFRTMKMVNKEGPKFTTLEDLRVTQLGRLLRKFKLDELPQLFNVLKGDMSLVGPRPELPEFAAHFPGAFDRILQIRPGITDLASIQFRDESALIQSGSEVEKIYVEKILPKKLEYNLQYLEKCGFLYDISIIFGTLFAIFLRKRTKSPTLKTDTNIEGKP